MTDTVRVRPATPDDAAVIHRFISELAAYEREPDAVEATPEVIRSQMEQGRAPFECLIGELGGDAVGFALFFHNYSTWKGRHGLYLEDLYVTPVARGAGVGKALLVALARLAVARGCGRMEWMVLDWNTPAIDFYRALGAGPMEGWTTFRLTGDALAALGGPGGGVD